MKNLSVLAVLSALLLCLPARATDYYVATNGDDSNPGTINEPFRTIQKAADPSSAVALLRRVEAAAKAGSTTKDELVSGGGFLR